MLGIKAKELKDALKDVPDDYVVRIDAPKGSIAMVVGTDRCGDPLIDDFRYQLDEKLSEVKGVDVNHDCKEVVIDAYIHLEEATYG
jgi:hypothetical protein